MERSRGHAAKDEMLTERAQEHIRGLEDEQLAEYIATGEQIYDAEAVNFARQEFAHRRLDGQQLTQLESEAKDRVEAESAAREAMATMPLDWDGKALAFIGGLFGFAVLFLAFRIWVRMDIRGERRKSKDMKRYFLWGLATNILALATMFSVWAISRRP